MKRLHFFVFVFILLLIVSCSNGENISKKEIVISKKECKDSRDCKLVYNRCSCAAVPKNTSPGEIDKSVFPKSKLFCFTNECVKNKVHAICLYGSCARSDAKICWETGGPRYYTNIPEDDEGVIPQKTDTTKKRIICAEAGRLK